MDYQEYLYITVLQENKPVTYKSMARSLGMHVNKAKQALYEFAKQHPKVHSVYCLSGTTLLDNHFTIQLVKDTELEEAQKKFKKLTGIHVYSLCSFDPTDFSVFYTACKDAPKLAMEDRIKCGVLKNPDIHVTQANKQQSMPKSVAPSAATASPKTLTNQTASSNDKKPSSAARKRKGALNFGPSTTKKQAVSTSANNKKEPVVKPVASSTSGSTVSSTSKKPETDKKPTAKTEEIERRMAKTSLRVSDIFSSDEEDNNAAAIEARVPVQDNPNEEEDNDIEMEDIENSNSNKPQIDDKEDMADTMENDYTEANSAPPTPGKARRKVLKKKTYKNARGLLVTEDVWEWEEVDEDITAESKATPPPKPAKAAPSKPSKTTKTTKKPAAQSNLFNFFKKA